MMRAINGSDMSPRPAKPPHERYRTSHDAHRDSEDDEREHRVDEWAEGRDRERVFELRVGGFLQEIRSNEEREITESHRASAEVGPRPPAWRGEPTVGKEKDRKHRRKADEQNP